MGNNGHKMVTWLQCNHVTGKLTPDNYQIDNGVVLVK